MRLTGDTSLAADAATVMAAIVVAIELTRRLAIGTAAIAAGQRTGGSIVAVRLLVRAGVITVRSAWRTAYRALGIALVAVTAGQAGCLDLLRETLYTAVTVVVTMIRAVVGTATADTAKTDTVRL